MIISWWKWRHFMFPMCDYRECLSLIEILTVFLVNSDPGLYLHYANCSIVQIEDRKKNSRLWMCVEECSNNRVLYPNSKACKQIEYTCHCSQAWARSWTHVLWIYYLWSRFRILPVSHIIYYLRSMHCTRGFGR